MNNKKGLGKTLYKFTKNTQGLFQAAKTKCWQLKAEKHQKISFRKKMKYKHIPSSLVKV